MKAMPILIVCATLYGISCSVPHNKKELPLTMEPHIHIQLVHEGQQPILDARVRVGPYTTLPRGLAGKGASTHLFFDHPLTPSADIVYRLPGSLEEVIVPVTLPSLPKTNLNDVTFIFLINADVTNAYVEVHPGIGDRKK